MNLVKTYNSLCSPAALYLVLSLFAFFILIFQNINNRHTLCIGNYSCPVSNVSLIFVLDLILIIFWTWVLNLICKSGWSIISWTLVLFPFILTFLLVILGMSQY